MLWWPPPPLTISTTFHNLGRLFSFSMIFQKNLFFKDFQGFSVTVGTKSCLWPMQQRHVHVDGFKEKSKHICMAGWGQKLVWRNIIAGVCSFLLKKVIPLKTSLCRVQCFAQKVHWPLNLDRLHPYSALTMGFKNQNMHMYFSFQESS